MSKELVSLLNMVILGNPLKAYLLAVGVFLISLGALYAIRKILIFRLKRFFEKTPWRYDDLLLELFEKFLFPLFYVGAFYFSIKQLNLHPVVDKAVTAVAISILVIQATRFVLTILLFVIDTFWLNREKAGETLASKSIVTVIRVVVWGVAIVFLLDNLGFNVSAVVAGLGIGGVAVALAAQTILGDLFNYFVIFFDKPFVEGDFIIVDEYLGTIEHIGIKTTRVRSLTGEQLIFSNSDLTSSRIRNYKRMAARRVLFTLGVIYETPLEKLQKIPSLIRQIIEGIEGTRFDRAHFKNFGDFSLIFEVVYYVLDSDYNRYMDIQQAINFRLKEVFAKEDIVFAYPTQLVYMQKVEPVSHP